MYGTRASVESKKMLNLNVHTTKWFEKTAAACAFGTYQSQPYQSQPEMHVKPKKKVNARERQ